MMQAIDIAEIISGLTGAKITIGKVKGHDPSLAVNIGRIPGWLPQVSLQEGIKAMVDEARKKLIND